jgi:glycosyltransferase involved in cell wall biosynthesis
MKISYYTVSSNLDRTRGYGNAGFQVVTSLQQLGHEVPFDDSEAPVQICFCQPQDYKFNPGQYKIGYTPWESTELPDGWLEAFNACDEVWATSDWTAEVYRNAGVTVPVKTYEHGLDPRWEPRKRVSNGKINFLHVGEPALRKGGQMAIDAFRAVFGDRDDVHLTVKAYYSHYLQVWKNGKVVNPEKVYNNVTILTENMHFSELQELYYSHDVLIYPSYGEGFGFIPLQALGTGMPVVCTDAWAPYDKYLGPLKVRGRWDRSIWSLHPGDVYYPDYDELKQSLAFAAHDFDFMSGYYYAQARDVHKAYNWLELTEKAFAPLVSMFTNP